MSKADDDTLTAVVYLRGTPAYGRALARAAKTDGHTSISEWVDFVLAAHVLTRQGVKLPPRARAHGRPRKPQPETPAPARPRGRPRKDATTPKAPEK